MKKVVLSTLFCALCAPLFAQIQIGLVREQNSNRKPVPGVQINFSGAVPTTSDDKGIFRLAFQGKKPGDLIFYTEIGKVGYELVNGKELQMLKIGSTDQLAVDIILAKAGTVDAAKKEYYSVSDKALLAGFNRKKQELQAQIKKAEISQQEFLDRFEGLQEQYERQRNSLDELAEKFAKVNFDDVSEVYQEALKLFKAGKIDEAIQKLEDADFLTRAEKRFPERIRLENAGAELAEQNAENEKGLREDLEAALKLAQIYVRNNRPSDALPFFELLLFADGENPKILMECAGFFKNNGHPDRALPLFQKLAGHPDADDEQKAKATEAIIPLTQKKD